MVTMKLLFVFTLSFIPIVQPFFQTSPQLVIFFLNQRAMGAIDKTIKNTQCATDLKNFISDSQDYKIWALKMLDASGKLQPGVLYGNVYQYGNYEQCLAIEEKMADGTIQGQYCSVSLTNTSEVDTLVDLSDSVDQEGKDRFQEFSKHPEVILGLCVPKSCSPNHLSLLANYLAAKYKLPVHSTFNEKWCSFKNKEVEPYRIDSYVFYFFSIIFAVVLASTIYDILAEFAPNFLSCDMLYDSTKSKIIAFSLYTNTKNLLSTRTKSDSLTCLYGLRVLSMAWIIVGNIYTVRTLTPHTNAFVITTEWIRHTSSTFILSSQYAIETFFAISGLVVSHFYLKYSEKIKINLLEFYFARLLRSFPALFATVLLYLSVAKYWTDGPFWPFVVEIFTGKSCGSTWWNTLSFTSNYVDIKHQCITHAWFLSIDTQLYLASPLILFSISRFPRKITTGIILACFGSMLYSFVITFVKKLEFLSILIEPSSMQYDFLSPICRMPSWLIGVLFGYFLYHQRYNQVKIPKRANSFLWVVSLSVMLWLILANNTFARNEHTVLRSVMFNALARPVWACAVCFIIFSCSTGQGGNIHSFLSHPVFMVLDKLTYSMFLLHGIVTLMVIGSQMQAGYFRNYQFFMDFCALYVLIGTFAVVWYLVFERPILELMKCLQITNTLTLLDATQDTQDKAKMLS